MSGTFKDGKNKLTPKTAYELKQLKKQERKKDKQSRDQRKNKYE